MQVIFLPHGSGRSFSYRCRIPLVSSLVAGVVLSIGLGGGLLGYHLGQGLDQGSASEGSVPQETVDRLAAMSAGKLVDLRESVAEQREMLRESRQRLGDHFDSLGQRLGQLQAHVSRLNALGQRLTDMAGLDHEEFSFDTMPAMGGPEKPSPWGIAEQPELARSLEMMETALREKESELRVLEALLNDRELHRRQYPQGWPASGGWISSSYGYRNDPFTGRKSFHEGVDIAARSGSEVLAMAKGVVSFAGEKSGYGLVVEINHGNGYETRYAHAKKILAQTGDQVEKGDPVALVGSTGRSTGSHVHFEVLKHGEPINPHDHLNAKG